MPFLVIVVSADGHSYGTAGPAQAQNDFARMIDHAKHCVREPKTRTVFLYEARTMPPELDVAQRARERRRWLHPWLEPFGAPLAVLGDLVLAVPEWIQEIVAGRNPTS